MNSIPKMFVGVRQGKDGILFIDPCSAWDTPCEALIRCHEIEESVGTDYGDIGSAPFIGVVEVTTTFASEITYRKEG
jgi:hypothetical protein